MQSFVNHVEKLMSDIDNSLINLRIKHSLTAISTSGKKSGFHMFEEKHDSQPRILAEHMRKLLSLRTELRAKINQDTDNIYYRNHYILSQKDQFRAQALYKNIQDYLYLQQAFIKACEVYLQLNELERSTYWSLCMPDNSASIHIEFHRFLQQCDFSKITASQNDYLKATSYLFQNFHSDKARDLLNQIAILSKENQIPLVYQMGNHNEIQPVVAAESPDEERRKKETIFSKFKTPVSQQTASELFSANLEDYFIFLKENLCRGDVKAIKSLVIIIPKNDEIYFSHAVKYVDNKLLVTCCMLDFAQLNLHEFAHGHAYLQGHCIHPDINIIPLPRDVIIYSNAEELRNITQSSFSENSLDVEGPQRIGHKGILSWAPGELDADELYYRRDANYDLANQAIEAVYSFRYCRVKPPTSQVIDPPTQSQELTPAPHHHLKH